MKQDSIILIVYIFFITGVVCQVNNEGVLLQLFNDVCGWVPKSKISVETIEHPEKLFFLGQVLKSKVLDVTPHKKRMSLTLILTEEKLAPLGSKQKKISEKIQRGVVYENIKVIQKSDPKKMLLRQSLGTHFFLQNLFWSKAK